MKRKSHLSSHHSSSVTITVWVSPPDFASNHCNHTVNIIYHLISGKVHLSIFNLSSDLKKKFNNQLLEYTVLSITESLPPKLDIKDISIFLLL